MKNIQEVQLGKQYYTNYLFEIIEVEAVQTISNSHSNRDREWDIAVRVKMVNTGYFFLRRVSELWN